MTKERTKIYHLEWPIVHGDEYSCEDLRMISLHRLTGAEVADLQDRMQSGGGEVDMIAAFTDVSADVIGQLDADDYFALRDLVLDFLPKKMRAALETVTEQAPSS